MKTSPKAKNSNNENGTKNNTRDSSNNDIQTSISQCEFVDNDDSDEIEQSPKRSMSTDQESSKKSLLTPNKKRKRELEKLHMEQDELTVAHTPMSEINLKLRKFNSESFVMKLFDRSLDLSKYTEKTPLYPICRAWIANQPRNLQIRNYREDENYIPVQRKPNGGEILAKLRSKEINYLHSMPLPKKSDMIRIPPQNTPRKLTANEQLIESHDPLNNANSKQILEHHLQRWKKVKKDWRKHVKCYQQRYELNFQILEQLQKF